MTFQKRLLRVMKRRGERVADLARHFDEPYTTVREWAVNGRLPVDLVRIGNLLEELERAP
jgi:hypothetical protein